MLIRRLFATIKYLLAGVARTDILTLWRVQDQTAILERAIAQVRTATEHFGTTGATGREDPPAE